MKPLKECASLNPVSRCGPCDCAAVKNHDLYHYFETIPIPHCVLKILLNQENEPFDAQIVYSNREHSRLEGVAYGELIGKQFYQKFKNRDKSRLAYYYDTAFNGTRHCLESYIPEMDKYFQIQTYPLEEGFCGCIVNDITTKKRLEIQLDQERARLHFLLKSTTDVFFQYDFESKIMRINTESFDRENFLYEFPNCPQTLVEKNLILRDDAERFQHALERLKSGENAVSLDIRARLRPEDDFSWYSVRCLEYIEIYTNKRRILGSMKNIDQIVHQRERLRKEAMLDPLLEIFNVKTGRRLVEKVLLSEPANGLFNIMFLMDLDSFKSVNDTYGHRHGDDVLKTVAGIITKSFRSDDIVYRLGGDEFIGFVKSVIEPECAIERITASIFSQIKKQCEQIYDTTISIGIIISNYKRTYEYYYQQADRALYEAKRTGKNRYFLIRDQGQNIVNE